MVERLPELRSTKSILTALIILFAAVFFLPYFVPVVPVDSLSYVVGYSNRTAIILLCRAASYLDYYAELRP